MDSFGVKPCSFCGTCSFTNARLESRPMGIIHDGPSPASVLRVVFCTDCADNINDYLRFGEESTIAEEPEELDLTDSDISYIMGILERNSTVLLTGPNMGSGIRYVDGDWKHAHMAGLWGSVISIRTADEVKARIEEATWIKLKSVDSIGWDLHEESL